MSVTWVAVCYAGTVVVEQAAESAVAAGTAAGRYHSEEPAALPDCLFCLIHPSDLSDPDTEQVCSALAGV